MLTCVLPEENVRRAERLEAEGHRLRITRDIAKQYLRDRYRENPDARLMKILEEEGRPGERPFVQAVRNPLLFVAVLYHTNNDTNKRIAIGGCRFQF